MKFYIEREAFTAVEPAKDAIPLKALRSGCALFLNPSAAPLLATHGWVDFEEFAADAGAPLRRDFEDALTALECFELAKVAEREARAGNDCRVAGEKDYAAVSAFIRAHMACGHSYSPVANPEYYSAVSVRARQFNNSDYHFMKERGGELIAVLIVTVPTAGDVSSVVTLHAAVFSALLNKAESAACLHDLLEFAELEFKEEFSTFRFLYTDAKQDAMLSMLLDEGFTKVCTLEKELNKTIDLVIYDLYRGLAP